MKLRVAPESMRIVKEDFLRMPFTLRESGQGIPVMAARETSGSMSRGGLRGHHGHHGPYGHQGQDQSQDNRLFLDQS